MADSFDYQAAMDELDQRVAVLRRYHRMLELQKDKLSAYLHVVDTRDAALAAGNMDHFETYTQLEQEAVRGILTVQRCLEPLKVLYLSLHPEGSDDIRSMEERLERLRQEVLARNQESCSVLRDYASTLKTELSRLRRTKAPLSVYAGSSSPSMVDISL